MNISKRSWLIAGAAGALVLVPAGVSFAVANATDATPAPITDRFQPRADAGGYGANVAPGRGAGQVQGRAGNQFGDTDRAQDQTRDRDRDRDQIRDPENCDGDGPIGQGPPTGTSGGMMGGRGGGR